MRRAAALGALPFLTLVTGQGIAVGATSGAPVRVTASIRATGEDTSPARTYGSPYLAVDPENPNVVVAATPEMRTRACRFMRSLDAGRTWKLMDALPDPATYPFCQPGRHVGSGHRPQRPGQDRRRAGLEQPAHHRPGR